MRKRIACIIIAILCLVALSSCLPGDGKNNVAKPAGFFTGFWHGLIAPISLIVQIFNKAIRVYEQANTGFWYDLGFWIALSGGAGGSAVSVRYSRRRRQQPAA
ncbi:MAG TPA: hypothetical protein PLC54_03610 [Spirochaetales bacterium]|nr:hypothetical protein [Spirochaetales bacterium]